MDRELKKAREMRRKATHSKAKEISINVRFEINGSKNVEDVITYIRDVWKDYKFKEMSIEFKFKKEKKKFLEEISD